jgi:hypothetical protein
MPPAQNPDDSTMRLERIIALIDDLDRLKRDPKARQIAIERMKKEVAAAKQAAA